MSNTALATDENDSKNWRFNTCSTKARYRRVFEKKLFADVSFIVGEEQTQVRANKVVLSIASPIFEDMFSEPGNDIIEVPDLQPTPFEELLRFCYCGDLQLNKQIIWEVLSAARKYQVDEVTNLCFDFLQREVNDSNALRVLKKAREHNEDRVVQFCLDIIDCIKINVDEGAAFNRLDEETVCLILQRDTLETDEINLFRALVRWTEAECNRKNLPVSPDNKQSVAKNAVSFIRFPLMTLEEFVNEVPNSGILSVEDQLAMLLYFNTVSKPPTKYNVKPRAFAKDLSNFNPRLRESQLDDMESSKGSDMEMISITSTSSSGQILEATRRKNNGPGNHTTHIKNIHPKEVKEEDRIFVSGVSPSLADDNIKNYFTQYGTIVNTYMPYDEETKRRKNFCFISFASDQEVVEVLKTDCHSIHGHKIHVERALSKPGFGGRDQGRGNKGS